jgi:electron transfer flavoprotein beta subunit
VIAACVKWVPSSNEPGDDRFAGISAADQAALEMALRQAAASRDDVLVVTAGPPAADRALRDALACGATRILRIDQNADTDSAVVAARLAAVVAGASVVWCGDYSPDRGSGSVPAFLAAELHACQALGAVGVDLDGRAPGSITVIRRLDGGRREVLDVVPPAVVSVEGSVARLRRAGLPAVLAARTTSVESVPGSADGDLSGVAHPYRPRARALAAPNGSTALDRLRELTDAVGSPARSEVVHLDPTHAAARIIATLRDWGYLTEGSSEPGAGPDADRGGRGEIHLLG